MRSLIEKDIEDYLVLALKSLGHLCLKLTILGRAGWPDRLCLFQGGRVAFVELKAPGQKPKAHQQRVHALLRTLGFTIEVIDTKSGVDLFVARHA